ncbi:MAG: hypothetical protein WD942_00490 [Dehalococcoidia bacterium]
MVLRALRSSDAMPPLLDARQGAKRGPGARALAREKGRGERPATAENRLKSYCRARRAQSPGPQRKARHVSREIFSIGPNGEVQAMAETPYESEIRIQELIASHPEILGLTEGGHAVGWVVVREAGIPDAKSAPDRFSVDHFLLDPQAIPTFVETKQASSREIRRSIVGQMFDYAANAVVYWPADRMRTAFLEAFRGDDPDAFLREKTGRDPEDFWAEAHRNLSEGKLRLVFVADRIPANLRRIIEFLNERMESVEVLGVELRQYLNVDGVPGQTIVPTVIGRTATAERVKAKSPSLGTQTLENFFALLEENVSDPEAIVAMEQVYEWTKSLGPVEWGNQNSGFRVKFPLHDGRRLAILSADPKGYIWFHFGDLATVVPFDAEQERDLLRQQLNEIPAIEIRAVRNDGAFPKYSRFPVAALRDEHLMKFQGIVASVISRLPIEGA